MIFVTITSLGILVFCHY